MNRKLLVRLIGCTFALMAFSCRAMSLCRVDEWPLSITLGFYERYNKKPLEYYYDAISKKYDVNLIDHCGKTLLFWAAYAENYPLSYVLLKLKADPNKTGAPYYHTPLHAAAANQDISCLRLLIHHGAKESRDYQGNMPAHFASSFANFDTMLQLIIAGCSFKIKNNHGQTPLYIAARREKFNLVQLLVSVGARLEQDEILSLVRYLLTKPMADEKIAEFIIRSSKSFIADEILFNDDILHLIADKLDTLWHLTAYLLLAKNFPVVEDDIGRNPFEFCFNKKFGRRIQSLCRIENKRTNALLAKQAYYKKISLVWWNVLINRQITQGKTDILSKIFFLFNKRNKKEQLKRILFLPLLYPPHKRLREILGKNFTYDQFKTFIFFLCYYRCPDQLAQLLADDYGTRKTANTIIKNCASSIVTKIYAALMARNLKKLCTSGNFSDCCIKTYT